MLRHYRGPCGRRRRADSGPSRAGRQRFERSPPVGAGSDLAHGQQQPLVARRGRHRRNTGREHLPQPGRQSRAVRHGAHRQGALRTEHHALPQHVRIRRRNVRPHRQIGHGVQSADRNAPHDRRRSFRRLFGRRRARLHGGSRIPHGTAKNTARSSRPTRPDTANCWGTASCSTSRTRGAPYASKLPNSP